jgi:hypothetical protein
MSAGRMIYLTAAAVCVATQATAAEFARAPLSSTQTEQR